MVRDNAPPHINVRGVAERKEIIKPTNSDFGVDAQAENPLGPNPPCPPGLSQDLVLRGISHDGYHSLIYYFLKQKPKQNWKITICQFNNEVLKETQAFNNTNRPDNSIDS